MVCPVHTNQVIQCDGQVVQMHERMLSRHWMQTTHAASVSAPSHILLRSSLDNLQFRATLGRATIQALFGLFRHFLQDFGTSGLHRLCMRAVPRLSSTTKLSYDKIQYCNLHRNMARYTFPVGVAFLKHALRKNSFRVVTSHKHTLTFLIPACHCQFT